MRKNGSALIKKGDIILLILLLALAGICWFFISSRVSRGNQILIRVDGKNQGTYLLSVDQEIPVKTKRGYNRIVIRDGKAFMEEADCPDKICVNHASICRIGESIICLPHKLVVSVEGSEEDNQEPEIDVISR